MTAAAQDPRYPVGKFQVPETFTPEDRNNAISTLGELPTEMRNAFEGLSNSQINTPYREGGWTLRQVVHHVADSHMNAFIRLRLALTEDWPVIKPYKQDAWAVLHDVSAPVEWSLQIIESVHARWVMLLQSMDEGQWQRGFVHPENGRIGLEHAVMLYAWHSRHHLAHITHLRAREKW